MILFALLLTAASPCDGVLDRTATCSAPDDVTTAVAADEKRAPPAPAFDVDGLPAELAFLSASLAFGGASALVLGLATTASNDGEVKAQQVATYTGAGLLIWSGLTGAGAAALALFDPSTGTARFKLEVQE